MVINFKKAPENRFPEAYGVKILNYRMVNLAGDQTNSSTTCIAPSPRL